MSDVLEFRGGAFLVRDKTKGDIGSNYIGWACIKIIGLQIIEIGYFDNSCIRLDNDFNMLSRFILNTPISEEKLELIGAMCSLGFNTTYAYNYAQLSTYLLYAKSFFINL